MATNDIYQLKLTSVSNSEVMQNVFYYRDTAGAGNALELVEEFTNQVLPDIQAMQNSLTLNTRIQAVNGMFNTDSWIEDMAVAGDVVGTPVSTFLAVGFRKRFGGIGFRYSYKRFYGLYAGSQTNFGVFTSGTRDMLDPLAVKLGQVIEGTLGAYQPVQITGGFVLGTAPVFKQPLQGNWQYSDRFTHQDSRQQYGWLDATP